MEKHLLYTTQLQAGLGVIEETKTLLELWEPGMSTSELIKHALDTGAFPNISARRLRNLVSECFSPRYLVNDDYPASILKQIMEHVSTKVFTQLLFIFTCRANQILGDFVRQVFWHRYSSGHDSILNENARDFVLHAIQEGRTIKPWSESTIRRISSYLTGACRDFLMLEPDSKNQYRFALNPITPEVAAFLAYDLHFAGLGDNAILSHEDWELFGMDREDSRYELRKLTRRGYFILQTAGDAVRFSWSCKNWGELINVLTQG